MTDFFSQYRDMIGIIGILITFFFRSIWAWRQKICFEYKSKKDVAISILRDKIVQRIEELRKVSKRGKDTYQQLEKEDFLNIIKKMNSVNNCFGCLDKSSQWAIISLWISIVAIMIYLVSIWFSWSAFFKWLLSITFIVAIIFFLGVISLMIFIDGRFFRLVNKVIEPEHE